MHADPGEERVQRQISELAALEKKTFQGLLDSKVRACVRSCVRIARACMRVFVRACVMHTWMDRACLHARVRVGMRVRTCTHGWMDRSVRPSHLPACLPASRLHACMEAQMCRQSDTSSCNIAVPTRCEVAVVSLHTKRG